MSTPLLKMRSLVAAKVETTKGTAESITVATDGAMNIYDFKWTPPSAKSVRQKQVGFGNLASIAQQKNVTFSFTTDFVGSGTSGSPLYASTFFPACGYPETTGTFGPATADVTAQKTATFVFYNDGKKHTFAGCMGNFTITITNGQRGTVLWEFTGKYMGPADVALPAAPSFPTTKPPRGAETLTYGSYTPFTNTVTIKSGNTITLLATEINDANATGFAYAVVSDSNPTIDIQPQEDLVANEDYDGLWAASTEATFTVVSGSASNNTMTVAATSSEVYNPGGNDEREGVVVRSVNLAVNGSLTVVYA